MTARTPLLDLTVTNELRAAMLAAEDAFIAARSAYRAEVDRGAEVAAAPWKIGDRVALPYTNQDGIAWQIVGFFGAHYPDMNELFPRAVLKNVKADGTLGDLEVERPVDALATPRGQKRGG